MFNKYKKYLMVVCVLWVISFLAGFVSRPKGNEEVAPVIIKNYGISEIKKEMNVCVKEIDAILKDNQFMGVKK